MTRYLALAAAVLFLFVGNVLADDAEKQTPDSAVEKLRENPDDLTALQTYLNLNMQQLILSMNSDPERAEKKLAEVRKVLESLQPTQDETKQLIARVNATLGAIEERVALARTSLEELAAKLRENPDDAKTVGLYANKTMVELSGIVRTEPEKAAAQLKAALETLQAQKEAAKSDAAKQAYERAAQSLARLESTIESSLKLTALIGTDAVPLEVENWVNGSPLTDADLKGKVVLLDFWAVWCGPCIATFPHLREWQEKYAEKGLVIIGLTRYYNYKWDDAAQRAARAEGVTPEQEREMLVKFAEQHNLHHRFGIQGAESKVAEHYGVTGIPHVVLIDRQGKVRLMRVGSGEANAQAIGEMLEKLIADAPSAAPSSGE